MANEAASRRQFSELARRVINHAAALAQQFDHPYYGVGHLLLALAREARSPTAQHLRDYGLDVDGVWYALRDRQPLLLTSPFTIIDAALVWAHHSGSHYCGTEHLLLALTADDIGGLVLALHQVDVATLHHHLTDGLR